MGVKGIGGNEYVEISRPNGKAKFVYRIFKGPNAVLSSYD